MILVMSCPYPLGRVGLTDRGRTSLIYICYLFYNCPCELGGYVLELYHFFPQLEGLILISQLDEMCEEIAISRYSSLGAPPGCSRLYDDHIYITFTYQISSGRECFFFTIYKVCLELRRLPLYLFSKLSDD